MGNLTMEKMEEMIRPLLVPEQNLYIGSPNGAPIRLLNRYPSGKFLFFDDDNFVYYAHSAKGDEMTKNDWDKFFRFPYLYCSWHAWGSHTFKLVKHTKTLAEFASFDEALTSLLTVKNECQDHFRYRRRDDGGSDVILTIKEETEM